MSKSNFKKTTNSLRLQEMLSSSVDLIQSVMISKSRNANYDYNSNNRNKRKRDNV